VSGVAWVYGCTFSCYGGLWLSCRYADQSDKTPSVDSLFTKRVRYKVVTPFVYVRPFVSTLLNQLAFNVDFSMFLGHDHSSSIGN